MDGHDVPTVPDAAAKDPGLRGQVLPGEFEDVLGLGDKDPSRADARGRARPPLGLGHHVSGTQDGVAGGAGGGRPEGYPGA